MNNTINLPSEGFVRLPTVLGLLGISKTSLYEGIKKGIYPPNIKLGIRSVAWRVEDIRQLIAELGGEV